ncbi:hypothetical protein A9Q99_27720 [Gammaproteobacteria bacterium 45_16_T64]|nr:hypothetical protein A9Q99_27720 [Gammaproteobacteria bacterium 45_16_T64]
MNTESRKKNKQTQEKSSPTLINNIGDRTWYITDSNTGEVEKKEWKSQIKHAHTVWIQTYLLNVFDGYSSDQQEIVCRTGTFRGYFQHLNNLIMITYKLNIEKPISSWDKKDLKNIFIEVISWDENDNNYCKTKSRTDFPDLKSKGSIEYITTILRLSYQQYTKGILPDGLRYYIPEKFEEFALKDFIESKGYDYYLWKKGGSAGSIPLHISTIILSHAIKILHSNKTKLLLAYFDFQRTANKLSHWSIFRDKTVNRLITNNFKMGKGHRQIKIDRHKALESTLSKANGKKISSIPWSDHSDVKKSCDEVYDASIIIFLCLTGIRISELSTIQPGWFNRRNNGVWEFKSEDIKTNHGLITIRNMAGLVAEAADTIERLSYIDKNKDNYRLFSRTFSQPFLDKKGTYLTMTDKKKKSIASNTSTLRMRVKSFYEEIINIHGDELRQEFPTIQPIQFRHTWAEFAMRRFEGNVLEAIRHHFRHSASHSTRSYTNQKLTEEERILLEKDYIAEIIHRMGNDEHNDFTGPIASYIKKRIKETHDICSAEEAEQAINKVNMEFESIIAHEWGYCLVRIESRSLANCYDSKTGIPRVEDRACFETCSNCIHRLSHSSQKEDIQRIGLSHKNFIDNYPLQRVTEESIKIVEKCEAILDEMEAS